MQRKKKQPNEKGQERNRNHLKAGEQEQQGEENEPEVKKQPENGEQAELTGSAEEAERRHQKILEKIQEFRPMDDDFLRAMLRDDLPLAQMMFRIIMNKDDLVLTSFHTQEDMKQIAGARSICLDAYAVDGEKRHYDLEIQRADAGANPHRARYHSSVLDVENLRAGQDFRKLPDTYVIFITEKDFFHGGKPLYVIDRMNRTMRRPFGDGAHIVYVNGEYRGEDALGRLMHDFNCQKADEMHYELMAEQTRYLKETEKGREVVCKLVEELCVESREEGREEGLRAGREEGPIGTLNRLVRNGRLTMEAAADDAGMSVDEFERKVKKLIL